MSIDNIITGINDILVIAGDATTNPDPNSLTTVAPYTIARALAPYFPPYTPSTAWLTQGNRCLLPTGMEDNGGQRRITLHCIPSGGAAVTYTVGIWFFNPYTSSWAQPVNTPTVACTGSQRVYIDNPGTDAIFIQLSSISTGTVSIHFTGREALSGFEISGGSALPYPPFLAPYAPVY